MRNSLAQFELIKAKITKKTSPTNVFYGPKLYVDEPAENHTGFIWSDLGKESRLIQDLWGEGYLYNLSLWKDIDSLQDYLSKTPHIEFMKKGDDWFYQISKPRTVLWWVPEGHFPCVQEAHNRLELLYEIGPSYQAFDLKSCARVHQY
ncbi:DUF3291 domain-containing protein [Pseudomonas sp. GM49]|uniref:DUF3291 domain-containing protein n=1 Tax=Pseudomonas sp. GM49 TaxID=1144331 RepID=UPI0009DADEC7|nr:DUF3291 domain-containing protein [Pseudomonas sp. GM49]